MNRITFSLALVVVSAWILWTRPPYNETPVRATIPEGVTVSQTAKILGEADAIVSPTAFTLFASAFGGVRYGTYAFSGNESVIEAAWRVAHGETHLPVIKITIPEGSTVADIATILARTLPGFNVEKFLKIAKPYEGYLFPETYYFAAGASTAEVIEAMHSTFDTNVVILASDFASSSQSVRDVITMASIIQGEARGGDQAIVSGILWHRLAINMRLQVDVATSTYQTTGLPTAPINNPGIEAIKAALHPKTSPFLFYLTGADGMMHYAKTFAGQVANRKYLK